MLPKDWISEAAFHPNDPKTNAQVMQLTGDIAISTNIYNEDPGCNKDGRMVITRSQKCHHLAPSELSVVDIEAAKTFNVDDNMSWQGAAAQAYGDVFYYPKWVGDRVQYKRLSISSLETQVVYEFEKDEPIFRCHGSVSPCGRYVVNLRSCDELENEVVVFDSETKAIHRLVAGPDYFNPHPRFDRMQGDWILVQHNRGQRLETISQRRMTDDSRLGTTLRLFARGGGESDVLPIARPEIEYSVSGHESWVAGQMQILLSLSPVDGAYKEQSKCSNLIHLNIGDELPTCAADAPNTYFGHVSTSSCGKYHCCDIWDWDQQSDPTRVAPKVVVGNIQTGKFATVCEAGGYWPRYENGHVHPYLSADNKYVIFTSTRTGLPQVYRARVPDEVFEQIDATD